MTKEKAIICCADVHLMSSSPIARLDNDILDTFKTKLNFISDLSTSLDAPVVIAGDLFDHWDTRSDLLNFAIDYLPKDVYCIAGNHDQMYHSRTDMHRTGLGVLHNTGRVKDIGIDSATKLVQDNVLLHGFPYGEPIRDCPKNNKFNIAVIHRYISPKKEVWEDASKETSLVMLSRIKGYDLLLTGDNHMPFVGSTSSGAWVINPGSILRRTAAQMEFLPRIYVLYPDRDKHKWIETVYLPIKEGVVSRDHLQIIAEKTQQKNEWVDCLASNTLNKLFDFKQNVIDTLHKNVDDTEDGRCIKRYVMEFLNAG